MKNFVKKIVIRLFFRPFFKMRASSFVYNYLNKEAVGNYFKHKQELNNTERRVVNDLLRDGIAVSSLKELFPDKELFSVLRSYADRIRPQGKKREGKPFLVALWDDNVSLSWENPFTPLSLSQAVLNVVSAYFSLSAKFFYYYLDVTLPVGQKATPLRSQNWHRDPEDRRMCKMFVYLNDVDENSGPFIYIKGSQMGGRYGNFFPQNPPKGSYPTEEQVSVAIPQNEKFVGTGRAGTVIFADTAGLHRGGYAISGERWMFTADYSSPAALRNPLNVLPSDSFVPEELSRDGHYALIHSKKFLARVINKIENFSLKYGLY